MDQTLKALFESGKSLLTDTKQPRKSPAAQGKKGPATKDLAGPPETDPFRIFVRKCTSEKVKKVDMVKDIERFIKSAEEAL